VLSLAPDTIWVSSNHGSLETGIASAALPAGTQKFTTGATRGWSTGDAFVSYWQSSVGMNASSIDVGQWSGRGLDAGGNLYFGKWLIYGSVSVYSDDNRGPWSSTAENSVSGSLLLTWNPTGGPSLTAGVMSYRYGYSMLDYGGFYGSDLQRFELAADFSRVASARLDWDIGLKFLASYRTDVHESQWGNARSGDGLGKVFVGLRLGLPLQS